MHIVKQKILITVFLCIGIFLHAFILNAYAGNEEIVSLFTPVIFKDSLVEKKAVHAAIPGSVQDVIINLKPLKSRQTKYRKLRLEFLGRSIIIQRKNLRSLLQGTKTWTGKPLLHEGSVTMSMCGKTLFGRIELDGEVYKIEPVRGTNNHRIFQLDSDLVIPIDNGGIIPPVQHLQEEESNRNPVTAGETDEGEEIDVLILYTEGFADEYPDDELKAQISYLAGLANTAYVNSDINDLTVRVVAIEEVDYKDSGSTLMALERLTDGDDVFSGVADLRDKAGADLVVLLRVYEGDIACGIAWQMTSLSSAFAETAYSVVNVGESSCGSNCTLVCSEYTMAHEMGHNMGCAHDRASGPAESLGAIFSFSYGYTFGEYRSVMATSSGTRIGHFSNPKVEFEGLATGEKSANNTRSIKKVKEIVSQFRDTECPGKIKLSSKKLSLENEEVVELTVSLSDELDNSMEGEKVKAKIKKGKNKVSVSPSKVTTDAEGNATFTITAQKPGKSKVVFKSGCLKKSLKVKIEEAM